MKETIYTIPINGSFDRYDGCPICFLYESLERASLEYIMGAAMMEPDVRIKTNELGFCHRHLTKMLAEKNKLSLALILESHLPELSGSLFTRAGKIAGKEPDLRKAREAARAAGQSCYVCDRVSGFMKHYYNNIFYLWKNEPDFKEKFSRQPFFCMPHYSGMLEHAEKALARKEQAELANVVSGVCSRYLSALKADVSEFCKSFDYRNAGRGLSDGAQNASERAAAFLTGSLF